MRTFIIPIHRFSCNSKLYGIRNTANKKVYIYKRYSFFFKQTFFVRTDTD